MGPSRHVVKRKLGHVGTVPNNHVFGLKHAKIAAVENLEALARRKIRALYERVGQDGSKWTAEKLAPFLGMSDPSGVRKLLNGDNKISLAHLQGFCEAFCVTPAELVTPEGSTFVYLKDAEPTLLKLFREMDEHERLSLLTVLKRHQPVTVRGRRARGGHVELTDQQQLLVDLFARVKKDAIREGVLKTLRGAAAADHDAAHRTTE